MQYHVPSWAHGNSVRRFDQSDQQASPGGGRWCSARGRRRVPCLALARRNRLLDGGGLIGLGELRDVIGGVERELAGLHAVHDFGGGGARDGFRLRHASTAYPGFRGRLSDSCGRTNSKFGVGARAELGRVRLRRVGPPRLKHRPLAWGVVCAEDVQGGVDTVGVLRLHLGRSMFDQARSGGFMRATVCLFLASLFLSSVLPAQVRMGTVMLRLGMPRAEVLRQLGERARLDSANSPTDDRWEVGPRERRYLRQGWGLIEFQRGRLSFVLKEWIPERRLDANGDRVDSGVALMQAVVDALRDLRETAGENAKCELTDESGEDRALGRISSLVRIGCGEAHYVLAGVQRWRALEPDGTPIVLLQERLGRLGADHR